MQSLLTKKEQLEREIHVIQVRRMPTSGLTDKLRSIHTVMKELEDVEKRIEQLNQIIYSVPKITKCGTIQAIIEGRWIYGLHDGKIKYTIKLSSNNTWYSPEDMYSGVHTIIETDKDNIPILIKRQIRNSDTYGYLYESDYPVILEVKLTEDIKRIEPKIEQQVKPFTRDQLSTPDKLLLPERLMKYNINVDTQLKEIICPRCKIKIMLGRLYTLKYCPNCALPASEFNIEEILKKKEYINKER